MKNEGKATNKKRSYWGDRNRDGAGTSSGAAGGSKADDIFALDLGLAGDNQTIKSDPSMSSAFSAASFSSGGGADGTNADGSGAPKPALIFRGMVASAGELLLPFLFPGFAGCDYRSSGTICAVASTF